MNEAIFTQAQKEMDGSVAVLRKDLTKLRTGRASTSLLEHLTVDYYGASTPINQLATLSAPDTNPTANEIRAPKSTRVKRSRPSSSVPNQCANDGAARRPARSTASNA